MSFQGEHMTKLFFVIFTAVFSFAASPALAHSIPVMDLNETPHYSAGMGIFQASLWEMGYHLNNSIGREVNGGKVLSVVPNTTGPLHDQRRWSEVVYSLHIQYQVADGTIIDALVDSKNFNAWNSWSGPLEMFGHYRKQYCFGNFYVKFEGREYALTQISRTRKNCQ